MGSSLTQDFLELAADYAEFCVLVTTSELTSPGPQILYANTAFTRMTGYSVSDLLGKTPRILQGPDTDRELLANLRASLERGDDFIARTTNYKRDGTPFELEWIISHLRDEAGRTTHYIAVQRDIAGKVRAQHELKKYDDELRQARSQLIRNAEELKQAERYLHDNQKQLALGQMAAAVMHDIGNAIGPIFSLVKLLHSVDQLPARARKISDSLDTSVEHAMSVLGNLRQYYENTGVAERSLVNLQELVRKLPDITSARWWNENEAGHGKLNFSINAPDPVRVECNEVEMLQVMVNMVLNAIEAMPDGGTISIELAEKDNQAMLSISDTGVGMSEEQAGTCFDPYVTGRATGTGLGLAVCKAIIEDHGGSLKVSTDQPQGVTFTITLPLVQAKPSDDVESSVSSALVVADDSQACRQLVNVLSGLDIAVNTADGPDDALQEVYAGDYGMIVIDLPADPSAYLYLTRTIHRSRPDIKVTWCLGEGRGEPPLVKDEFTRPDAVLEPPGSMDDWVSLLRK